MESSKTTYSVTKAEGVTTGTSSLLVNNSKSGAGNIKSSVPYGCDYQQRQQAEQRRSASWSLMVRALSNSTDKQDKKEAEQLMSCRGYVSKITMPNGKTSMRAFARSCNHRFCPYCEKRTREEVKASLVVMSNKAVREYDPGKYKYMWVTLTLDPSKKGVPTDSRERLLFLRKQGTAYLNRKEIKSLVLGSYNKIETGTFSNDNDHHHIHSLMLCDSSIHQSTVRTLQTNWSWGHAKVKVWNVENETSEASLEMSKPTLSRYMGKVAMGVAGVSEEKLLRTIQAYRGRRIRWSTGVFRQYIAEGKDMSYEEELEQKTLPTREEDPEPVEPIGCDKLPDGNYSPLMLLNHITGNTRYSKYAKYMLSYYDWSLRETRRIRLEDRLQGVDTHYH